MATKRNYRYQKGTRDDGVGDEGFVTFENIYYTPIILKQYYMSADLTFYRESRVIALRGLCH